MWFTVCFCSLPFTGYEPCALTKHTSSSTSRQFTPRVATQQELSSTSYCSFSVQALLVCYLILITQISKSSIPRSFLRWSVLATPCSLRLELPDSHVQHVPWSDHSFLRYSSFSFGDLKSLQSNFKIILPCISGPSKPNLHQTSTHPRGTCHLDPSQVRSNSVKQFPSYHALCKYQLWCFCVISLLYTIIICWIRKNLQTVKLSLPSLSSLVVLSGNNGT